MSIYELVDVERRQGRKHPSPVFHSPTGTKRTRFRDSGQPNHSIVNLLAPNPPQSLAHPTHPMTPTPKEGYPPVPHCLITPILSPSYQPIQQTSSRSYGTTPSQPPPISVTMLHLYPEVLTLIFKRLANADKGSVAQVCHYFNQIMKNTQIWKGTTANLNLKQHLQPTLHSLTQRGITSIQVLSLKRSLRELTSSVTITHLTLSGCNHVSDYSLFSMQNLSSLIHLDLSLCKQITDLSLSSIVGKAPSLKTLRLGGCTNLSDRSMLLVSYGLRHLEQLDLRSCYNLTDRALTYLSGNFKINQKFEVKTYDFLVKTGLLETPHCDICKKGSKYLYKLPKLTDKSEFGMLSLKTLILQDCQKISDEALQSISKFPTIQNLNLSFCMSITDTGLKYLKNLTSLRELNLRNCDNISDAGLVNLKECRIEHLDVSFCEKVTLLNQHICKYLNTLSLSACDIEDKTFIGIKMDKLEKLNVGQCNKITDLGLKYIVEKFPRLKYIDLYGCLKITSKQINHLSTLPKFINVNIRL